MTQHRLNILIKRRHYHSVVEVKHYLSLLSVLLHESSNIFLVHPIILILLPLQSWHKEHFISPTSTSDVLLDFHIVMTESWDFTSLPRKVANVDAVLDWHEEEQSIGDDGPFVDVPPHGWVRCLHHYR